MKGIDVAAGFTYDPATLREASKDLAKGSATVEGELARLATRIAPLQNGFKGAAAEGFQTLFKDWQDSAKKLRESLDALSKMLDGAATNAQQMEEANTRLMRG